MLANRLKELRAKKQLSQNDLARILEVAQQTVASWEKSNSSPNYDILCKIADYFCVTTDYLLGRIDYNNTFDSKLEDYHNCLENIGQYGFYVIEENDGSITIMLDTGDKYAYGLCNYKDKQTFISDVEKSIQIVKDRSYMLYKTEFDVAFRSRNKYACTPAYTDKDVLEKQSFGSVIVYERPEGGISFLEAINNERA